MRIVLALLLAAMCGACVTSTETVSFKARPNQEAIVRDGVASIMSRQKASIVTVSPALRELPIGRRPIFTVQIQNTSRGKLDFSLRKIQVEQIVDGAVTKDLHVYSYEELTAEERTAQVNRAILVGLASGLNSYSAGRNYWAQANAANDNAQLAAQTAAQGQANLAALETAMLKDDTLMPGETYGGQLQVEAPEGEGGTKDYVIRITIGPDRHEIYTSQGRVGS